MRVMVMVKATADSEVEDFGAKYSRELREHEARQRARTCERNG